jgi:heptosyltransferase I
VKILILKPSSLGDVVQALPVLRLLKAHWPQSEIHWWIASGLASLLEDDPDLSGLIVFHRQRWQSPWRWAELARSVREMRRRRFDLVIDLQGLARSGAVCWLANGGQSIGLGGSREGARGFYDAAVDRPAGHPHAVHWYVRVLEELRVPAHWNFDWLPLRPAIAAAVREKWPLLGKRFLSVCPGARWMNKRWPLEHFTETIRLLARREPDLHFAIVGGAEDLVLGRDLSAVDPGRCVDLTGRTSLPELVEIVRLSAGMLTNDTGPMHIAAALGKPVTALFGPTAPEQTGPFGQMTGVLRNGALRCAPCLKPVCRHTHELECLTSLTPGRVADVVVERIT